MRYIKIIVAATLAMIFVNMGVFTAFAENSNFQIEQLPEEDIDNIVSNFNISLVESEPPKNGIICFDISENGDIAIGTEMFTTKTVAVYGSDGTFKYAYKFTDNGTYGIEWNKETLIICLVRSSLAVSVTPYGEIESVAKIQDTIDNSRHWRKDLLAKEREFNGAKYSLKNNMGIFNLFAFAYSQLIITNADGSEIVFYDASATQLLCTVLMFVFVIVFVGIVVFSIVKPVVAYKKQGDRA